MSILVLGTVALDTVTTPQGARTDMLGGSAVHFSMSARLFTPVHLVAVVGQDFPGKHRVFLKSKGLNIDSVTECPGTTFRWTGEYEGAMNSAKTLKTELGVLVTGTPCLTQAQRSIPHVFLANYDPEAQVALLSQMKHPRLVALDSMNFYIHSKKKELLAAIGKADIYFANDQEARDLTGEPSLLAAARRLCALGPKVVVIKKGEHGVMAFAKGWKACLPAFPVQGVVDPTGAGDTFAGGFLGYLSKVKKLNETAVKKALAFGTIAASFNVEAFGVERTRSLTMAALNARLAEFKRMCSFS